MIWGPVLWILLRSPGLRKLLLRDWGTPKQKSGKKTPIQTTKLPLIDGKTTEKHHGASLDLSEASHKLPCGTPLSPGPLGTPGARGWSLHHVF